MTALPIIKAHAYGNDFLFAEADRVEAGSLDPVELAQAVCARHTGIGADGLGLYRRTAAGATMHLLNADGSYSEVSGNGVRCLATILARERNLGAESGAASQVRIETGAGLKVLTLVGVDARQYRFRAAMGQPEHIRRVQLDVEGECASAVALTMGNPQCVVLGPPLDEDRLARFGKAVQHHALFPAGTNFELAVVEAPDRVRILIWERGVGPTWSSGTGSCASAVAAITYGGANHALDVVALGGTQRVEWTDAGVFLTGVAEVVLEGTWAP